MPTTNTSHYEAKHKEYSSTFYEGSLTLPPKKKLAIIICMDARIHPERIFGLEIGDAHVIRNAGGRAFDAVRSLIVSQRLLGTEEIFVVHHTDCGMTKFTDEELRQKLKKEAGGLTDQFSFMPFKDLKQSVIDDVEFLNTNHYILQDIPITGYIYHVEDGSLEKVCQVNV